MDIQTLGQHLETFAFAHPLGAILPRADGQDKSNRNWHPEEGFHVGKSAIAVTMAAI
jgi:hypothetical protein